MAKINVRDIAIASGLIGLSVYMILNLLGFRSSVAGTIGPGVYPLVTLILLILTGLIIIVKAFVPTLFRLISPFAAGSRQGLMIAELAGILSRGLGARVAVKPAFGQGFFSARYIGTRAKPDGSTLTIVTGDRPSPSCFHNASLHLKEFELISLLAFDPDVFVARAEGNAEIANKLTKTEFIKAISSAGVGFSHQKEMAQNLRQTLIQRTGVEVREVLYESTQIMLESLEANQIAVGLCPLSDLIGSEKFRRNFRLLAVGALERLPDFPNAPTLEELGIDLVWGVWIGLALPRGAPPEKVQGIWSILAEPDNLEALKRGIRQYGCQENVQGPEKFRQLLEWQRKIGEEAGLDDIIEGDQEKASLLKVLSGIGLFMAFMVLGLYVGYLYASLLFMFALSIILWPRRRKRAFPMILVTSVGISLGIYWVFTRLFNVVFP